MAGINSALEDKMAGRDRGMVVAMGILDDDSQTKYIIVKMENNSGYKTYYDYKSDIRIRDNIKVGDRVYYLVKPDSKIGEWVLWDDIYGLVINGEVERFFVFDGERIIEEDLETCMGEKEFFKDVYEIKQFKSWLNSLNLGE